MIKEIRFSGYAAQPNERDCADGQMDVCLNLANDNGAIKAIRKPVQKFALLDGEKVLWIHTPTGHKHYIIQRNSKLYFICENNCSEQLDKWSRREIEGYSVEGNATITSMGNTLIVNDDKGIHYILWRNDSLAYLYLGQKPPMLEIQFGLHSEFACYPQTKNTGTGVGDYKGAVIDFQQPIKNSVIPQLGNSEGDDGAAWAGPQEEMSQSSNLSIRQFANNYSTYSVENINAFTTEDEDSLSLIKNRLTQGAFANVNKLINELGTKENKFVFPFFVRYAYRLFDGSYMMHSYPVLMVPNMRGPIFGLDQRHGLCLNDNNDNLVHFKVQGRAYAFLCDMVMSITNVPTELEKWKDIIVAVDIAVTPPVFTFDQSGTVYGWTNMDEINDNNWNPYYTISKCKKYAYAYEPYPAWSKLGYKEAFNKLVKASGHYILCNYTYNNKDYNYPSYILTLPLKNNSDIVDELTRQGNFYVIKSFDLDELKVCDEAVVGMQDGTLSGLLGRSKIGDDYHTHDIISSNVLHGYNARMNYCALSVKPHKPINPSIQFTQMQHIGDDAANDSNHRWKEYVSIIDNANSVVVSSGIGYNYIDMPLFVFYPDSRANFAFLGKIGSNNTETTYKLKLTKHEALNGAYWLGDLFNVGSVNADEGKTAPSMSDKFVYDNYIYTSNVNNPFIVEPANINAVGSGRIIAITTASRAMSQGQFGQYPLYAFAEDGVWSLAVANNGTFSSKQAVTRDVLLNGTQPLQLDAEVLFATDRGIIELSGSNASCITNIINTTQPFDTNSLKHIERIHSMLGHDDDGCLSIVPFADYLVGCGMMYDYKHQHIYLFNNKYRYAYVLSLSSKMWSTVHTDIDYSLNSYPDALAVHRGVVMDYSTMDGDYDRGLIVTRPMKLETPELHKTITKLIVRGDFDRGDVKVILYASNDLSHWHYVYSSVDHFLRGFSGSAWKYYRIAIVSSINGEEAISSATIDMTIKGNNQIR